eukprot:14965761-Alexandrium_andersonii.AAC.1
MMHGVLGGPDRATVVCSALCLKMRGALVVPVTSGDLGSPGPAAAIGGSMTPVGGTMTAGGHGAAGGATRAGTTRVGTTERPQEPSLLSAAFVALPKRWQATGDVSP